MKYAVIKRYIDVTQRWSGSVSQTAEILFDLPLALGVELLFIHSGQPAVLDRYPAAHDGIIHRAGKADRGGQGGGRVGGTDQFEARAVDQEQIGAFADRDRTDIVPTKKLDFNLHV